MSTVVGIVLISEQEAWSEGEIAASLSTFSPVDYSTQPLDTQIETLKVKTPVQDQIVEFVSSQRYSAMGFWISITRLPTHWFINEQTSDEIMNFSERMMIHFLRTLSPLFGYLSIYDNQLEEDWLESEVLSPLLLGESDILISDSYHYLILSPAIHLPMRPSWLVVDTTPSGGSLVCTGTQKNPFD